MEHSFAASPMQQRTIHLPEPIDLTRTLKWVRRGEHDPTCRLDGREFWRTSRLETGLATLRLTWTDHEVEASAWGDGAEQALDGAPALIGCDDDVRSFAPEHPLVARLWRDLPGLRIPRALSITDTLISVVLEQRVTTFEARRSQAQLVTRWGEDAPGPGGLRIPPDPEVVAGIAYYDLHVLGVEKKRADTVRRVAANARQLEALAQLPPTEATARLTATAGVGPWSAAEVGLCSLGDADAVPVGDVHLPSIVTYALGGEAIDDDDVMLEMLEPFAGHRGRVTRLINSAGIVPPRQAPRYSPRDIRDQ